MKATSVRHAEKVGVRPAGQDDRRRAALARLQRRRRRAPGQVLRARARRAASAEQARTLASEVADKVLANPVIESYRIESIAKRSGAEADMKFGVVVFPGSNCDHDAYHAAKDVLGQDAEFLWHKDTSLKGADVVSCRAASRTATTCAPAPSRGSRRSCRPSWSSRERGGPVLGHLQRLPGPARGGPAARARCCATAT